MAAFRGMHVLPAKHSYAWLPRKCDYQTALQGTQQEGIALAILLEFTYHSSFQAAYEYSQHFAEKQMSKMEKDLVNCALLNDLEKQSDDVRVSDYISVRKESNAVIHVKYVCNTWSIQQHYKEST